MAVIKGKKGTELITTWKWVKKQVGMTDHTVVFQLEVSTVSSLQFRSH